MSTPVFTKVIPPKKFQNTLFNWFDCFGRKNLPWQANKTAYRVWVSEIMLQQTQVASVIAYFQRFMQAFPSVHDLAAADTDQVLHLWAGLGYYSRAHNLHRCSKIIVEEHAGCFPQTVEELIKLPGIGLSTASAIRSLAFDKPATILDGNVQRVLARLHGICDPINQKQTQTLLWQIASTYTPTQRCADYTQALMDFGATLCTPRQPKCDQCPYIKHCVAFKQGIVSAVPTKLTKAKLPTKTATFIILQSGSSVLLQKRADYGIWRGLWSLPELAEAPALERIQEFSKKYLSAKVESYSELAAFRHTFSHFHLKIHPIVIQSWQPFSKTMECSDQIWYNLVHPQHLGLPKPVKKLLEHLI